MAERIGIVGAGIMGGGIAQIAVQNWYEVRMTDLGQSQVDAAVARITAGLNAGVERGFVEAAVRDRALGLLHPTMNLEEVANASLIIENIYEEEDAKKELLAKLDELAPPTPSSHRTPRPSQSRRSPPRRNARTRSSGCTSLTRLMP